MKTVEFDYNLPKELIAQEPAEKRSESRLMTVNVSDGGIKHEVFKDITKHLKRGDVLVLNDTKVIPARVFGFKEKTMAKIEILILNMEKNRWECLVKNARAIKVGTKVIFDERYLSGVCIEKHDNGICVFMMASDYPLMDVLDKIGLVPLPPYIKKTTRDFTRYQTIYARQLGSSAAPTAGLHFTNALLEEIKAAGVQIATVTLHIGLGTFKPVEVEDIEHHTMHAEYYEISKADAAIIQNAKDEKRRVISVGTTSARALETVAQKYGKIKPSSGMSEIFIYPGYEFKIVDALITNFHLPKSTLLMMISAFGGLELIKEAYQIAIKARYRFFSFGDAMFLHR